MKEIDVEDIATIFASEFIKQTTNIKTHESGEKYRVMNKDFIKMNFARRRKLVDKVLGSMAEDRLLNEK